MVRKVFLMVSAFAALCIYAADIVYTAAGTNPLDLSEAANWSAAPSASVRGVIDFKQISTASNFVLSADLELQHLVLSNNVKGVVTINSANGSKLSMPAGSCIYNTGTGPLLIQSGTIASASGIGIAEGYVELAGGAISAANGEFTTTSENKVGGQSIALLVSAGSLNAINIRPGTRSLHYRNAAPDIRQTGGEVTASGNLEIGRSRAKNVITAEGSNPGDYRLEGGTLAADKLVLARQENSTSASNERYGRYVQYGGTATVGTVKFGSDVADLRSFGQFDFFGGTFSLGAGGFAAGTVFDSTLGYRFRQAGGTLKATDGFGVDFAWDVEPGEAVSVWDTNGHDVTNRAPLRGTGTFVKAGSGTLTLADASSFSGALAVNGGTLRVLGTAAEPVFTGYTKYLRFTAEDIDESATAGECDGTALTNWVSTTGTGAATYTGWAQTNSKPTVVTDGGRRWVYFDQSALEIPTAQNPVAGETNFLVALVFKTSQSGSGSGYGWWNMSGVIGNEQSGYPADWGIAFNQSGKFVTGAGSVSNLSGDSNQLWLETANSASLADGQTHVFLTAYSGNNFKMLVDGIFSESTIADDLKNPIPGRQALPCYVGAHNPTAAKFKSYSLRKGYMAELRIYGGKTFSRSELEALGRYLGNAYQAKDQNWNASYAQSVTVRTAFDAKPAAPALPAHSADWAADTLAATLADGDAVTDWPSVDGNRHATQSAATIRYWRPEDIATYGEEAAADSPVAPKFAAGAVNGHAALRFGGDKTHRTMLAVPAADSPVSGATNYTVAAVIQTTYEPRNASSWANQGQWITTILSTGNGQCKPSYDCYNTNSFFAGLVPGGGVHFTTAKKKATEYDFCYPSGPIRLNDGRPHCLVFAHDRKSGTRRVMIDGYLQEVTGGTVFSDDEVMLDQRVLVGVVDAANKFWEGDYQGDIAAFRLYGTALDETAMKELSLGWCAKYGITPIDGTSYRTADPAQRGLGATNVTVAAGATLALPTAESPYTVSGNTGFTCAGTVTGSLKFATGAELDLAASASIDDLYLDGATVVANPGVPGGTAPLAVNSLTLSGKVTFAVPGRVTKGGRYPLVSSSTPIVMAAGATLDLAGMPGALILSADGRQLDVHVPKGVTIILR